MSPEEEGRFAIARELGAIRQSQEDMARGIGEIKAEQKEFRQSTEKRFGKLETAAGVQAGIDAQKKKTLNLNVVGIGFLVTICCSAGTVLLSHALGG